MPDIFYPLSRPASRGLAGFATDSAPRRGTEEAGNWNPLTGVTGSALGLFGHQGREIGQGLTRGIENAGRAVVGFADWGISGLQNTVSDAMGWKREEDPGLPDSWKNDRYYRDAETVAGGFATGLSEFAAGYALGGVGILGRASSLVGRGVASIPAAGKFLTTIGGGATRVGREIVGDFLTQDGNASRIGDLAQLLPEGDSRNALLDYMGTDPDDSELEARAKRALDGVLSGVLMTGVGAAVRGFGRGTAKAASGTITLVKKAQRAYTLATDAGLKHEVALERASRIMEEGRPQVFSDLLSDGPELRLPEPVPPKPSTLSPQTWGEDAVDVIPDSAGVRDLWEAPQDQAITSAATSVNSTKTPATFKLVDWVAGTRNADIGGGRFDTATEFLKEKGVENVIFDPFNRTADHNKAAQALLAGGQADTATINNVLNVIAEPAARDKVIRQAADALKPGGKAHFLIYEGDKSGTAAKTRAGWQENRTAASYEAEVQKHFGEVKREGNMLVASNPTKAAVAPASFEGTKISADLKDYLNGRKTVEGTMSGAEIDKAMPYVPVADRAVVSEFVDRVGPALFGDLRLKVADFGPDGSFNFAKALMTISTAAIREGQFTRVFLHEAWHSLERFLSPESVVLLRRQFTAEKAAMAARPGLVGEAIAAGRVIKVDEAMAMGMDRTAALELASATYRFRSVQEWWAESLTDKTLLTLHKEAAEATGNDVALRALRGGRSWLAQTARAFAAKFGAGESDRLFNTFMGGRMKSAKISRNRGIGGQVESASETQGAAKGLVDQYVNEVRGINKKAAAFSEAHGVNEEGGPGPTPAELLADKETAGDLLGLPYTPLNLKSMGETTGAEALVRAAELMDADVTKEALQAVVPPVGTKRADALIEEVREMMGGNGGFGRKLDILLKHLDKIPAMQQKVINLLAIGRRELRVRYTETYQGILAVGRALRESGDGGVSDGQLALLLQGLQDTHKLSRTLRVALSMQGHTLRSVGLGVDGAELERLSAEMRGNVLFGSKKAVPPVEPTKPAKPTKPEEAGLAFDEAGLKPGEVASGPVRGTTPDAKKPGELGFEGAGLKPGEVVTGPVRGTTPDAKKPGELGFEGAGLKPGEVVTGPMRDTTPEAPKPGELPFREGSDDDAFDAFNSGNVEEVSATDAGPLFSGKAERVEMPDGSLGPPTAAEIDAGMPDLMKEKVAKIGGGTGNNEVPDAALPELMQAKTAKVGGGETHKMTFEEQEFAKNERELGNMRRKLGKEDAKLRAALDRKLEEAGLDADGVAQLLETFGGRKGALAFLQAASALEEGQFVKAMSTIGAKNKWAIQVLKDNNIDLGAATKVFQKLAGRASLVDIVNEVFINGILSGVKTMLTAPMGGLAVGLYRAVELGLVEGYGSLPRLISGGSTFKQEVLRTVAVPVMNIAQMIMDFTDSAKTAYRAFKAEKNLTFTTDTVENVRGSAISGRGLGLAPEGAAGAVADGLGKIIRLPSRVQSAADEFWKRMFFRSDVRRISLGNAISNGKTFGEALEISRRITEASTDETHGAMSYARLFSESLDEVRADKANAGLEPSSQEALARKMAVTRQQELRENGEWDIYTSARDWAEEGTMTKRLADYRDGPTNALDVVGRSFQGIVRAMPVMRLLFPFIRTPINIMKFAMHRVDAPSLIDLGVGSIMKSFNVGVSALTLGKVKPKFYSEWHTRNLRAIAELSSGKAGSREAAAEAMARMTLGIGGAITLINLVGSQNITGTAPKDKAKREIWEVDGRRAYSIKVGDSWISYQRLDPIASQIGIVTDLHDAITNHGESMSETDWDAASGLLGAVAGTFAQNATSKTFLTSFSEFIDAASDQDERAWSRLFERTAGSFIPNIWSQAQQAQDPFVREVRGLTDTFIGRLNSQNNELRRDFLGAPRLRSGALGSETFGDWVNSVNPIGSSKVTTDPLRQELAKLKHPFSVPKTRYGGLDLLAHKNNDGKSAFDQFMANHQDVRINGVGLEKALLRLTQTPAYRSVPYPVPGEDTGSNPKVNGLNAVIERYRQAAFEKTLREIPSLAAEHRMNEAAKEKKVIVR